MSSEIDPLGEVRVFQILKRIELSITLDRVFQMQSYSSNLKKED